VDFLPFLGPTIQTRPLSSNAKKPQEKVHISLVAVPMYFEPDAEMLRAPSMMRNREGVRRLSDLASHRSLSGSAALMRSLFNQSILGG
jgi:hypothetical protein